MIYEEERILGALLFSGAILLFPQIVHQFNKNYLADFFFFQRKGN